MSNREPSPLAVPDPTSASVPVMTSFKIEDPSTSDSGGAGPQPRSGHMTSCRLADNMDMTPSVEINVLKETRESARATAEASGSGRRARIPSRKALEASGKLKNEDIQWLTKEKKEEDAKRVKELKAQRKAAAAAGLKAGEVIEAVAIGGMGGGTSADTGGNGDGVETLSGLPKMTWRKLSPTEILEAAKRQPITKVAVKPPHCGSSVAASEKRDASDYEIGKRLIDTDAGTSDKCRHKKVVSEAHETVWMDSAKTSPGRSEDSTRQRGSLEVHKQALLDHTRGILPRSSSREAIVRDGERFSGSGQIGSVSVCHFEGCSRKATFGVNGNVRYWWVLHWWGRSSSLPFRVHSDKQTNQSRSLDVFYKRINFFLNPTSVVRFFRSSSNFVLSIVPLPSSFCYVNPGGQWIASTLWYASDLQLGVKTTRGIYIATNSVSTG